ncbi:MAG TPA: AMIN domain-containing protein [Gemmatimonadaceae bacterium]|nr:AMIN domain-containing protein [Gemmatimonadaceae bacterium]
MSSLRTLASTLLVAFGAIGGRSTAAAALPTPNDATVTGLRVVSLTGRADVVISVSGAVTYKHFTLSKPDKIVVDIDGATLGLAQGDSYDGVPRGGITRIRYSQFTKSTVRVVLTLDAPHPYTVAKEDGDLRVSVEGATAKFEPWSAGTEADDAQALAVVTPHDVTPAASPRESEARPASRVRQVANTGPKEFVPSQTQQVPTITVNWDHAPIEDVLAMFSNFTGRTILPSKNVTGTVTANIINQPWDVALKAVMNANGYDVTVDQNGVIIVDTFEAIAARQATIPLQTQTIRLNYAKSTSVAPMVKERLSRACPQSTTVSGGAVSQPIPGAPTAQQAPTPPTVTTVESLTCPQRGTVTADSLTNSISITDVPSNIPQLVQYARSLDLRQPQVNIKAKIILVDRSTLEGLGLRYDLGTQNQFFNDIIPRLDSTGKPRTDAGQIELGGNTLSAIANATQRIPGAALQLVYSTAMGNFDFTTFLEALQTNTLLDVQAEPSTSVLNNRTANLTAGTQVPIRVIDAGAGGNNTSNFPRANVTFQQTGVILTVTPQITANRQVQMKIHVENSDVQFQSNDVGAVFPTQKVDEEVLVADGETAVAGGLTQTTVTYSRSGLPVLMDLPIIGRLFGVTNRTEAKRDLLILITPHIIDDGQQPPDTTSQP